MINTAPGAPAKEAEPIKPTLNEVARSATAVAAQLEHSQAEQPMVDLARGLQTSQAPTLCFTVLAASQVARDALLRWLVGPHHALVQVEGAAALGVVEIQLQQQGFAIGAGTQKRQQFSSADEFGLALSHALPAFTQANAGSEPLVLALACAPAASDLRLAVLPAPGQVPSLTSLPARLAARPSVLLVVAEAAHRFGPEEQAALAALSPLCFAAWPVVVGETEEPEPAARTARAWGLGGLPLLPAQALALDASTPLPDFLKRQLATPMAAALQQITQARAASALVDMLAERHESEQAQVRSRLKREQRLEKSNEGTAVDASTRSALDQARAKAAEEFTMLAQSLRETQRRSVTRSGPLGEVMSEVSRSVQERDLLREEAGKLVRLSLDPAFSDQARSRLAKAARRQLDEHCIVIRDSFELIRGRAETALAAGGARTLSVPLEMPDATALWEALRDSVQVSLRYRGEIPRRGFMQRLGAGRQMVFGVLMVLSLVGSFAGFNVRRMAFAGVFMLLLFIAAVVWTFHSWKAEDAAALTREMEKVREGVLADLERLGADVSRDMQARLLEFIEVAKREFGARLDAASKEWQSSAAAQLDGERKETRQRIKLIEQRDRELQTLAQQLGKARLQAMQVNSEALGALRDALLRPVGGGT